MIWLILGKTVAILFLLLALILSLVGFAGSVVAFLTALAYGWATGFTSVTGQVLAWLAVLMVIAETIEMLSGTIGARTFQASRQALIGSVIGLVVGFLFGLVTFQFYLILVGLIAGTVIGEIIAGRRETPVIFRSVLGVLIGKVGGILVKTAITLSMVVIILWKMFA